MMEYELTEECYDILLEDFNEWSETYYQLFGIDGISGKDINVCLLYTSPSPRDREKSRMPSSA